MLLSAPAVGAQSTEDPDSVDARWNTMLNTVVVTGTRTPKLLKDSPILTRVIGEADIKRTDATNISDLLQAELPGIEFTYSMNQQVNLNMQGFGGNSVLFLVDGERLAGETLDNIDYNRLNLNNVGRIEIVKGGASSLYGSNAVGGVVNLITKESSEPWTLELGGRYGAHNEQRYNGVATFKAGIVSSSTTAQYHRINSYNLKNPGDYTRFYGGHNWNIAEKITVRPTDALRLTGRLGYYFRQRNSSESIRDRYRDFTAGLRGFYDFGAGRDLELAYNFDQYDKSDFQPLTDRDVRKYSNVQNSVRAIYNHTFAGRHLLTVGGDFMRDYLKTYQFADGGHKSQQTADALAQLDLNFVRNLNFIVGGRYDYFSEARAKHFSARASAMYKLPKVTFRGSYSGGFRAPTLKEMYMDFDMAGIFTIYGNPDLKPETSHNFQVSAEYTRHLFNLTVGGFYNMVDNRITTAWNTALNGQMYTNIGRVNIGGIEANASWRHRCGAGLRLSYIFTHEHVRKGEPYTASTRPHTATARFDYTRSWNHYGITASLNGRFLSGVNVDEYTSVSDYSETQRVHYPAYTMWRLNVSNHIWRGIDLNIAVDNLFNYVPKYNYSNSPTTTGTTLSIGLVLKINEMTKRN